MDSRGEPSFKLDVHLDYIYIYIYIYIDYWLLVIGNRLLVIGYWLLVIGINGLGVGRTVTYYLIVVLFFLPRGQWARWARWARWIEWARWVRWV